MKTDLWFSVPVEGVLNGASTAEIDVFTRTDEHVVGRDDIGDRGTTRVVFCQPDRDRDIVRRAPECDWKETVQTEKKLSTTIVVRYGE